MKLRQTMPDLTGETAWINERVTREDLVGQKPALIHFWSVSCDLCSEAMQQLHAIRERYKSSLSMVAVHMPRTSGDLEIRNVRDSIDKYKMTQPVFIDHELKLTKTFGNQFVPSYYLFDHLGKLRHVQAGGGGMHLLEMRIRRLLEEVRGRS